jgi:hypothetical protein
MQVTGSEAADTLDSIHTRRVVNRLSDALRLAATCLEHTASALGGYYRRMKRKLGAPQAITATAHKLARIIYRMLKYGEAYVLQGLEDYEKKTERSRSRDCAEPPRLSDTNSLNANHVPK